MSHSPRLNLAVRDRFLKWTITAKIFNILDTYLRPSSTIAPIDAAQEINQLFPLNRPTEGEEPNEEPISFLWEMWELVLDVVSQLPWDHPSQERSIDLLKALRSLPDPVMVDMPGFGEMRVWADLPILHPVLNEVYYGIDAPEFKEEEKFRSHNYNTFCARMMRDSIRNRTTYAICTMRDALEVEPDYRARAYHTQGPQLNTFVPIAATWIMLAGNYLFHCSQDSGQGAEADSQSIAGGRGWKGANGYSLDRWRFWKRRFSELKEQDQASEETREFARKAEDRMNKVEANDVGSS
ncbi:unnamed protein product [Cyclocybe aegerita]|uniref:Uncharacterized protein n=1 Tax=Cyclocybe aegerita TaxID=1973307 RepID=A0A8S0WTB8_CYCAE|nr:unnamed protein product [Cyclocybe aegerita]